MALTIRMRIDEQDEHSYVFSTGDGGQIELIPLSVVQNGSYTAPDGKAYNIVTVNVPETELEHLNITANGTYTAEDGTAYDVVTVNVQPILEAVTRSYTENGTYTIVPSEGKDGISGVTVDVNVPTSEPVLEIIQDTITQNGQYTYEPSIGYDGLEQVNIDVDVSGGGSSNVVEGTFTPSNGQSQSFSTGRTGTIQSIEIWTTDEDTTNSASVSKLLHSYNAIKQEGVAYYYKSLTYRSGTTGATITGEGNRSVMGSSATGAATSNVVGVSSNGGTIYYAGKTSGSNPSMGFYTGVTYKYRIVYQ